MSNSDLKVKMIRGSFWSFIDKISSSILYFLKIIIVAIIISPENYGLLWLVILTISFFDTITQIGFKQTLIQKKDDIKDYLNTAWSVSISRSLILYGILFFLAPLIAIFFEEPEIELILRVIGLNILFQGFSNFGVIYFEKELNFKKRFSLNSSKEFPSFIITILLLFYFQNLWAWVFGSLIGSIIYFIISYIIHPYRPKFEINRKKALNMVKFGKWILINSIIIFFVIQGDDFYVGKFFGAITLGYYSLAYKISNIGATEISHVVTGVAFPSFSIIQTETENLRSIYLEILQMVSFFVFPISGLIFILATNFTYSILGLNWLPIIPLIMILIIEAILRAIESTLGSLSQGIGYPNILTKTVIIQITIFLVLIYPMSITFGVIGVAIVVVLHHAISLPILLKACLPRINLNFLDWMKSLSFPLFSTLLMSIILYPIQFFFDYNILSLIIEAFLGIMIYLIFGLICLKFDILQSKKIFKELIKIKSIILNFNQG